MEKEMKTKSMFKMSIKKIILCSIFLTFGVILFSSKNVAGGNHFYLNDFCEELVIDSVNVDSISSDTIVVTDSIIDINEILQLDHLVIKNQLIAEVNEYISGRTRNKAHENLAEYIVEHALENNIDICFMMSQTLIETNFGTAGIGRESSKHSLFGVMKRKYSNYDEAIADYCRILKKYYLTKGRTEKDLMKKYVTSGGHRYAGNPKYEVELTSVYNKIVKSTSIIDLQKQYNDSYEIYLASLEEQELEVASS